MDKNVLRVKITRERLLELAAVYEVLLAEYMPENGHEWLLKEAAFAFGHRINKMLAARDQAGYTVLVSSMEALAFYQLWTSKPMPVTRYVAVVIDSVIAKIDQKHKHSKIMYAAF